MRAGNELEFEAVSKLRSSIGAGAGDGRRFIRQGEAAAGSLWCGDDLGRNAETWTDWRSLGWFFRQWGGRYPTNLLVIYGTLAEAAESKAAALRFTDGYLGIDANKIKADTEVKEDDLKTACLCLFGRPKSNKIAQRFKDDFPIQVGEDQFVWQGTT